MYRAADRRGALGPEKRRVRGQRSGADLRALTPTRRSVLSENRASRPQEAPLFVQKALVIKELLR